MKICNTCKREYEDHLNFCSKCGNGLVVKPQEYFCTSCGKSLGEQFDRYCPFCGCQFGHHQNFSANQEETQVNKIDFSENYASFKIKDRDMTKDGVMNRITILKEKFMSLFEGRRSRQDAIVLGIIIEVLYYALLLAVALIDTFVLRVACGLVLLYVMIIGCANNVKRVHDFNKSGIWFLKWMFIWCIGSFALLYIVDRNLALESTNVVAFLFKVYIMLKKGTDGPNQYGEKS